MADDTTNLTQQLAAATADVIAIDDVTAGVPPADSVRLRGRLLVAPDQAHERLLPRFRLLGRTPLLRRSDDGIRQEVLALPMTFTPTKARPVLALALFGLTVLSCLFVGATCGSG